MTTYDIDIDCLPFDLEIESRLEVDERGVSVELDSVEGVPFLKPVSFTISKR